MSLYFNAGVELLEAAQKEHDAALERLRVAEAVRDDARAHSQRLLDENRALRAELERVRTAGLALRDTAIDIEKQRHKEANEAINAELGRDIQIVELKAELATFKVRVAAILQVACEDGDGPVVEAIRAMPFVRDLVREWTCECDRDDHKGHRYDCELYKRLTGAT